MFEELDKVVLTHNIKEYNLKEGDRGTIVHVYGKGEGYEVEFFNTKGETITVLTLISHDIRSNVDKDEYLSHGFNVPSYLSTASDMIYTVGAENVLRGLDSIFGINESKIKTKSEKNIEVFHYPALTL